MIGESLWMLIESYLNDHYLTVARRVGGIHIFNGDEDLQTSLSLTLNDYLSYGLHEELAERLFSNLEELELSPDLIFPPVDLP